VAFFIIDHTSRTCLKCSDRDKGIDMRDVIAVAFPVDRRDPHIGASGAESPRGSDPDRSSGSAANTAGTSHDPTTGNTSKGPYASSGGKKRDSGIDRRAEGNLD